MTALTMAAIPDEEPRLQRLPWRRMGWVIWRQHRTGLVGVAVFLGAIAAYVWVTGVQLHHAYAAATAACHQASSIACAAMINAAQNHGQGPGGRFNGIDDFLANGFILQAVPALIGAFVGAPVLAREMETGTFRYAWTLGFGRWRWTTAKLVPLAIAVAAAAGALGVLLSWYYQPYFATANQNLGLSEASPFSAGLFTLRGVTFAAWTLAAFAIGALAGMLIRRVVPAIVATLAAYAGLAFAVGAFLREHYLTPLLTTNLNVPASARIISQWWTKGGKFAFAGFPPDSLVNRFCPTGPTGPVGPRGKPKVVSIAECLTPHGYTQWTSYQPASRFWPFQWIEGGWLLALSVLLIAATVWLVRRRPT
jgi:hypothetical protein